MIRTRAMTLSYRSGRGRSRREVRAVDGLDLDVRPGEIVSLLGPNGAGKTSTLRMLCTLVRPTSGEVEVAGLDALTSPARVRARIGYVGQVGSTSRAARAVDEVVDRGLLYGLSRPEALARARQMFAELDLPDLTGRTAGSLSGGQRRRLDLAMGLIHRPRLVFLDEPTTGLDPEVRAGLWRHIRELRDQAGVTVVLTTHYLDEADALSDRVVFVDRGRIIADDSPQALKRSVFGDLVQLTLATPEAAVTAAQVLQVAAGQPAEIAGTRATVRLFDASGKVAALVRALDDRGAPVQAVEVERPTLDQVFHALTKPAETCCSTGDLPPSEQRQPATTAA